MERKTFHPKSKSDLRTNLLTSCQKSLIRQFVGDLLFPYFLSRMIGMPTKNLISLVFERKAIIYVAYLGIIISGYEPYCF